MNNQKYIDKYNAIPHGYKFLVIQAIPSWRKRNSGDIALTRWRKGEIKDAGLIAQIHSTIDSLTLQIEFASTLKCIYGRAVIADTSIATYRIEYSDLFSFAFNNNELDLIPVPLEHVMTFDEIKEVIVSVEKKDALRIKILIAKYLISQS